MNQLLAPLGTGLLSSFTLDDPGPDAIEALYDRYAGVVFSLALRIVRDRQLAEEILEEVFFRAWQRAQKPQTIRGTVLAWLMEMTRAMAIEAAFDRRSSGQTNGVGPALDLDPEPDPRVRAAQQAMARALAALPPEQRRAIELAYFEGLTEREIADELGVSAETIRAWLGNATRTIGELLRSRTS